MKILFNISSFILYKSEEFPICCKKKSLREISTYIFLFGPENNIFTFGRRQNLKIPTEIRKYCFSSLKYSFLMHGKTTQTFELHKSVSTPSEAGQFFSAVAVLLHSKMFEIHFFLLLIYPRSLNTCRSCSRSRRRAEKVDKRM